HHWLDWLEELAPRAQLAFLTPGERQTYRDTRAEVARQQVELAQLRAMQGQAQWGARQLSADTEERLRQFLASRSEIAAGDRMVLLALRSRARERQRFWLGLPLLGFGIAGAVALARVRRIF